MLATLWIILNIAAIILILIFIMKVLSVVKKEMGLLSAIFLFIILSSVARQGIREKKESTTFKIYGDYASQFDLVTFQKLHLNFQTDSLGNVCHKSTDPSGTTVGIEWEETAIAIGKIPKGYEYDVSGVLKWKLLGIEVFRQHKPFHGFVKKEENSIKNGSAYCTIN